MRYPKIIIKKIYYKISKPGHEPIKFHASQPKGIGTTVTATIKVDPVLKKHPDLEAGLLKHEIAEIKAFSVGKKAVHSKAKMSEPKLLRNIGGVTGFWKEIKRREGISGTLEIGAGDRPDTKTTVAVDIDTPSKVPKKIKVIKSKTALPPTRLPLKLKRGSKLKIYWVGDANKMPPEFNSKFNTVISKSAVGVYPRLSKQKTGMEIASVLKPGGKVDISANTGGALNIKRQQKINQLHITKMHNLVNAGNLIKFKVSGNYNRGEFRFKAQKPFKKRKRHGRIIW